MTVHVLANATTGAGARGAKRPMFSRAAKPLVVTVFDFNAGTDVYSANGYDISDCWLPSKGGLATVLYIGIEQMDSSTASERRDFSVDYTAKTLVTYTAFNTEDTGNDMGFLDVRLLVVGY